MPRRGKRQTARSLAALAGAELLSLGEGATGWYNPDPVAWCHEHLNIHGTECRAACDAQAAAQGQPRTHHLTPYQEQIMYSVRDNRRTAVRSCNSVGKDFCAACIGLWWVHQGPDTAVVYTAPTWLQVETVQWRREIRRVVAGAPKPLPGELFTTVYRVSPTQVALGVSTNNKEQMSGIHAARILVIVTEASAPTFDRELWEGIDSLLASGKAHILLMSQPSRQVGQFYECFHGQAHLWNTIHVSADDTPNVQACAQLPPSHTVPDECVDVVPGATTHVWVDDMTAKYGPDNDFIRVHIRGDFPTVGTDTLIPLPWIEAAMERDATAEGRVGIGGDIARTGSDASAVAVIAGHSLKGLERWRNKPLTYTTGRLRQYSEDWEDSTLALDDTGLGGGVTDALVEQGLDPVPVNFGAKGDEVNTQPDGTTAPRFANKVAEMYWHLRERLDPDGEEPLAMLPRTHNEMPDLAAQLAAVTYEVDGRGRIKVDKRGASTESPDLADALVLALEALGAGAARWILA